MREREIEQSDLMLEVVYGHLKGRCFCRRDHVFESWRGKPPVSKPQVWGGGESERSGRRTRNWVKSRVGEARAKLAKATDRNPPARGLCEGKGSFLPTPQNFFARVSPRKTIFGRGEPAITTKVRNDKMVEGL